MKRETKKTAMKTTETKRHYLDRVRDALALKAKRAGIDITGVTLRMGTLDRTWGDRDGIVVLGGTVELRARIAAFVAAWCDKYLGASSYDNQKCVMDRGVVGWYTPAQGEPGTEGVTSIKAPSYYSEADAAKRAERVQYGHAVSTFYYPCAE